jgi:acetyl-CoA carboxylase carboxyltransferase component
MSEPTAERVVSALAGIVTRSVAEGTLVEAGATVAIIECMKMEYAVHSTVDGIVRQVLVVTGQPINVGDLLMEIESSGSQSKGDAIHRDVPGEPPVDQFLAELRDREHLLRDGARTAAVEKRHGRGLRTARENVAHLVDPGSFVEYGRFAYAAQTQRREIKDLIANTPGDGLIAGIGTVNSNQFGPESTGCAVLSYDYTVLAGTQGQRNHEKKDRLFEIVKRLKVPVVFFTEGGGGRPGDTDRAVVTGLNTNAFLEFARLGGLVPTIGIAAGRCFAGNAALLGCCDVVIACEGSSIGMGGPAMIEGGGLGVVSPDDVGPASMHAIAGSVDAVVPDEAAAVEIARHLLSFVQGTLATFDAADQSGLRSILPTSRRRAYDVRTLIEHLFDTDTVVELRAEFGRGIVTAFARIEGRSVGVLASNPIHLAGAIDSEGADKAARFMQLLEAWGLPLVTLVDTPGFMVGVEAERTGLVRHASRMFLAGAALTVPCLSVVTRRGYGLGAQAMCGGSFTAPLLTVAWPQAEMGAMGLEGSVRLGFRRELEAIGDDAERQRVLSKMIDRAYEHGRALNVASHLEIDDVIDPAETRALLVRSLRNAPPRVHRAASRRFVDSW